jgi:hypothetical protein
MSVPLDALALGTTTTLTNVEAKSKVSATTPRKILEEGTPGRTGPPPDDATSYPP